MKASTYGFLALAFFFFTPGASAQAVPQTELVGLAAKCLDVSGGDDADRTPVVLYECTGNANQRWTVPARGTSGPIVGLGGKCLDVDQSSTEDGARVQIYTCHGGANQTWTRRLDGQITGLGGKCLDVFGASTDDLTPVVLYRCMNGDNQRWRARTPNRWTRLQPDLSDLGTLDPLRTVAIDPTDSNRVFTGAGNYLLRTEDGGTNWRTERFPDGFQLEVLTPSTAALYAGGRDARGSGTVLVSHDGGSSWSSTGLQGLPGGVVDVAVSSGFVDRLLAVETGSAGGVHVSNDGGNSWNKTLTSYFPGTVTPHPAIPDRIYVGGADCVFRSDDGGLTWDRIALIGLVDLQPDPGDLDTLYGRSSGSIFRSTDGGQTWTLLPWAAGQRGYPTAMDVSELDSGRVVYTTGLGEVFLSSDGGERWVLLADGAVPDTVFAVGFDPDNRGRIWLGLNGILALGDWTLAPPAEEALLLGGNRFEVSLAFEDFEGNAGFGRPVRLSDDTGYFWFFDGSNVEVMVKVLDGRPINGRFWVFYGSLSTVEYTLEVRDRQTGQVRTYRNPSGSQTGGSDTQRSEECGVLRSAAF